MSDTANPNGYPILPALVSSDEPRQILDVKNTDVKASLKKLFNDMYTKNILSNVRKIPGRVLRVENDPARFDWNLRNLSDDALGIPKIRYKVWPDSPLSSVYAPSNKMPLDVEDGRFIVDLLPDCAAETDFINNGIIQVGDPVWITFDEGDYFTNPVIKKMSPNEANGFGEGMDIKSLVYNPSRQFANPPPFVVKSKEDTGDKLTLTKEEIDKDIKIFDIPLKFKGLQELAEKLKIPFSTKADIKKQASNGLIISELNWKACHEQNYKRFFEYTKRKMKLVPFKDEGTYKNPADAKAHAIKYEFYLSLPAHEAYIAMLEQFEKEFKNDKLNKTLTPYSVWRSQETQLNFIRGGGKYSGRYKWDPEAKVARLIPGQAAAPDIFRPIDLSAHGQGRSIDLGMGYLSRRGKTVHADKLDFAGMFASPIFQWLNENARKYSFYPTATGYAVDKSPEAWHWSFLPNPSDDAKQKYSYEKIQARAALAVQYSLEAEYVSKEVALLNHSRREKDLEVRRAAEVEEQKRVGQLARKESA